MASKPEKLSKALLISFCLLLISASTYSQSASILNEKSPRYGIYVNYNANIHKAAIDTLSGLKGLFPGLKDGNGKGASFGIVYELPLPGPLYAGLRAGYSILNGKLQSTGRTKVISLEDTLDGDVQSTLSTYVSDFSLEPYLVLNLFKGFDLYAGGHIGLISTRKYDFTKEILSPLPAVFPDTNTSSISSSGTLTDIGDVYSALLFGAGYRIPLNRDETFTISPEIFYTIGMTNIVGKGGSEKIGRKDLKWSINSMRFGVTLRYSPLPLNPELKIVKSRINIVDTISVETPAMPGRKYSEGIPAVSIRRDTLPDKIMQTEIISRVDTLFIYSEFKPVMTVSTPVIHIEARKVSEAFPLIPDVFFMKGSAEFTPFYNMLSRKTGFSVNAIENTLTAINNNMLNIIGSRLADNPSVKITLSGYADSASEKGDCSLARQRAEAVKNYLVSVWSINAGRIAIAPDRKNSCAPLTPTTIQNDSGYAENRRVMVSANDPSVLAPVVMNYMEVDQISSGEIIVDFSNGSARIDSQSVSGSQDGRELFGYSFDMSSKRFTQAITKDMAERMSGGQPLKLQSWFYGKNGLRSSASAQISVVKDTVESSIERYSLLLFNFASDEIQPESESLLNSILKGRKNAKITVTGYSDILGNPDFNRQLSQRRAENTARLIKKILPDADIMGVKGLGATAYPPGIRSYATPVERFLSRTVQIEIAK